MDLGQTQTGYVVSVNGQSGTYFPSGAAVVQPGNQLSSGTVIQIRISSNPGAYTQIFYNVTIPSGGPPGGNFATPVLSLAAIPANP